MLHYKCLKCVLLVGFYLAICVPEAETVEHSASNTRVMGLIPIGKCMNDQF